MNCLHREFEFAVTVVVFDWYQSLHFKSYFSLLVGHKKIQYERRSRLLTFLLRFSISFTCVLSSRIKYFFFFN